MSQPITPLDQFLPARLREGGGVYKMDEPHLGVAGRHRLGQAAPMLYIGRRMSPDEFRNYTDCTLFLGRHSTAQHLIEITRLNYQEYRTTIHRIAEEYERDYTLNWQRLREMVVEINRQILNFLTSMRTFLDHTQTRLDRTYGTESEQFKRFKAVEGQAFDGHFSYRFVYKLRNYTQHCGMPLGHINAGSKLETIPTGPEKHAIDFYFDKANLLTNFDQWGKHVEPELRAMPDQFPISPHIETTMRCLDEISAVVREFSENEVRQRLQVLEGFLVELPSQDGTPCVFTALDADARAVEGKTVVNMSFQRFHMQHIEETRRMLSEIAERNAVNSQSPPEVTS